MQLFLKVADQDGFVSGREEGFEVKKEANLEAELTSRIISNKVFIIHLLWNLK